MRSGRHRLAAGIGCLALLFGLVGCLGCGGGGGPALSRHLIVSVGDSVASGEGNPMGGFLKWLPPSWCHRSLSSGQAVAANELIASHPGRSLQFVSFACSGATIHAGLLGPFARGLNRPEPEQLDRVRGLLDHSSVDALMISIGANDVGFGSIVIYCATHDDCEHQRTFGPAVRWAKENKVPPPTLDDYVRMRIAQLQDDYEQVDEAIPAEIDRSHILIVEYFDPTRWPADTQCPVFDERLIENPDGGLVDLQESRWAHDHVLIPLNDAIRAAAAQQGWTLVDGVDEAFNGHGICAPKAQRWVRTFGESLAMQHGYLGTLHPNEAGHLATADLIRPKLAAALGLSPD